MNTSIINKSWVGVIAALTLVGAMSFAVHGCGGSSESSSTSSSTGSVYDIEASINQMQKDGKLGQMDAILWNTVPKLPDGKKWQNAFGDKLQWEEIMKDLCARQLGEMSKPFKEKILLLKKTYDARGLK